MNIRKLSFLILVSIASITTVSCVREYNIKILGTNDIHGAYFPKSYIDSNEYASLSHLSSALGQFGSNGSGAESVVLIDCGDNLQGNNASYYYNFVDTSAREHIMSRIFNFLDYDAVVVGNHDIEAGPEVYDRISREYKGALLAANAIDTLSGKSYFDSYVILNKGGVKVAVIGFTNPNVKSWVSPDKYAGLDFLPISSMAQSLVDKVRKEENPDLVILAVHSGIGEPSADNIENCAAYLASNITGIDIVMAAHDHRKIARKFYNGEDSVMVVEAGSKMENISCVDVTLKKSFGRIVGKRVSAELLPTKSFAACQKYDSHFAEDFVKVRDFSNMPIGYMLNPLDMNFNIEKESPYMKFIHKLQLAQKGVDISINAPLASKGVIPEGKLIYNDLFTLYRFENLLYVVQMSGAEIKAYLEAAYDKRLSKDGPLYNMDSAAGIIYTVSKGAPYGSRVKIVSMADGLPFEKNKIYNVAMTSYRASGAGGLLEQAGISEDSMGERIVSILPEIRELLYQSIVAQGEIDPLSLESDKSIGYWKFVK